MRAAATAAPRFITARSRSAAFAAAITAGCSTRRAACSSSRASRSGGLFRDKVRQPWYPVEERYGLIFAYMGPPEKKPVLPRYECLEVMDDGEFVEADDHSLGGGGPPIIPCNWLQHYENVVDPFHVPMLHASFSGAQFTDGDGGDAAGRRSRCRRAASPCARPARPTTARLFYRVTEAAIPTLRVVPNPRVAQFARVESIGWVLPIDDTSFRIYVAGRVRQKGDLGRMRSTFNGKYWWDMTEEEHQRHPGDYEAQVGQGAITVHSEEHFAPERPRHRDDPAHAAGPARRDESGPRSDRCQLRSERCTRRRSRQETTFARRKGHRP